MVTLQCLFSTRSCIVGKTNIGSVWKACITPREIQYGRGSIGNRGLPYLNLHTLCGTRGVRDAYTRTRKFGRQLLYTFVYPLGACGLSERWQTLRVVMCVPTGTSGGTLPRANDFNNGGRRHPLSKQLHATLPTTHILLMYVEMDSKASLSCS
jgi:hypothetical protein